jgi:hypothetical protein
MNLSDGNTLANINSNVQSHESLQQYALINILNSGAENSRNSEKSDCKIIDNNVQNVQSHENIVIKDQIEMLKDIR